MSQSAHLFLLQRDLSLACLPGIKEVHDKIARTKTGRAQYTPSLLPKKRKNSGVQGPGIHKIPGSKCILYEV